jgi:DNA replication protein DnaC
MIDAKETAGQIEYYSRAMKAPRIREAAARLAEQARETGWTHEEYLAAVLSREVAAREASGAEMRARAAGFPARKSLEDFSFDHQPGLKRDTIAHLATGAFLTEASNIVLLGPPGTGKTHLATGLGLRATQLGHRVLFATAIDWVARLQAAHQGGRLPQELVRLRRYGLIIVDLCRARNYAEATARPVIVCRLPALAARHSYRLSRNARILSGGWYRPGLADAGVIRARAFSLMVMSAWT